MPTSIEVWDVCEGSDITDGAFVKMRGGNTRTAHLPRVSLILNYEERDINLCLICNRKHKIISMFVGTVRPCNKLPAVQCRNDYKMHIRLLSKSVIYRSLLQWEKVACRGV